MAIINLSTYTCFPILSPGTLVSNGILISVKLETKKLCGLLVLRNTGRDEARRASRLPDFAGAPLVQGFAALGEEEGTGGRALGMCVRMTCAPR